MQTILLLKAKIAHSAGFYFYNHRWHKVDAGKPVPAAAPFAAHPHAAGQHAPIAHFTAEQWDKLKLPDSNVNAATFNKQLETLKNLSDAGNVTAILGMKFGTNTYSKKLAQIANHLLGLHGSKHQVAPGQGAGDHSAVKKPDHLVHVDDQTIDIEPDSYAGIYGKITNLASAGNIAGLQSLADSLPSSGSNASLKLLAQQKLSKLKTPVPAGEAPKEAVQAEPVAASESEKAAPEPVAETPAKGEKPSTFFPMPAFVEGKTVSGVVDYYEGVANKIMQMAESGDLDGLHALKTEGMKPNAKGKISNTWAGKTANSKALIVLHNKALSHSAAKHVAAVLPEPEKPADPVETPAAPEPKPAPKNLGALITAEMNKQKAADKVAQIPWESLKLPDSNSNAGTFNKKLADIKAAAEAGDIAKLESMKHGVNTYGKKAAKIAATAIAALKEATPAPAAPAPVPQKPASQLPKIPKFEDFNHEVVAKKWIKMLEDGKPNELKASLTKLAGNVAISPKLAADKDTATLLAFGLTALKAAGHLSPDLSKMISDIASAKKDSAPQAAKKDYIGSIVLAGSASTAEMYANMHLDAHGYSDEAKEKVAAALAHNGHHDLAHKLTGSPPPEPVASSQPPQKPTVSKYEFAADFVEKLIEHKTLSKLEDYVSQLGSMGMSGDPEGQAIEKYAKDGLAYIKAELFSEDGSPKEGDTKEGADGTLTFHNGRWHKQKQAAGNVTPSWLDGIAIPDLMAGATISQANGLNAMAKDLMEAAKLHGPEGLKGKITQHKTGKKAGTVTVQAAGYKISAMGGNSKVEGINNFHKFVTDLIAASGKIKKTSKPKSSPAPAAPVVAPGGIQSMDSWVQTGPQGGSNPGGRFKDENGVEWYCKFPSSEDVAKSEVLAAKLYAATGVTGQDAKLIMKGGKLGIASRWTDVSKASSPSHLAKTEGVYSGFAVDAWLGNWDVVGMGYDNLQIGADGKAVRVDAGGSLEYRAQGGKKAFGANVTELDSLIDPSINPQAAAVFKGITKADIAASASKVAKLSDESIRILVNTYGPGDADAKKALADILIARKADIIAKHPTAKKQKVVKFKPEKISEPPNFLNWGGSGKAGPSSKQFLNEANDKAVQAIYAAAKTGSIDAIKNLTAETYNKESGAVTGAAPVLQHPSQHVKGYAQQAINEINYQFNPPKRFRFDGGHPLHSLNSAYPSHKGALHGSAVNKVGKFVLLGEPGTISLDALALPKITHKAGQLTKATYSPAAKAAISKMPLTQQQAVQAYTGNGYKEINSSLWSGNPSAKAKSAAEALHTLGHDIAPGTVLSRKMSMSDTDAAAVMNSVGKILQEPAVMSTSIRPDSWSGNVHLKLHVGPGVKGLWVGPGSMPGGGALSVHASEDEIVLPPNTRLLILSTKKSNYTQDSDGFGQGAEYLVEAVVLPSEH